MAEPRAPGPGDAQAAEVHVLRARVAELERLLAERERSEEAARALADVGRELVETLDLAQATDRVVSTVLRLFGVGHSQLYELEPDGGLVCVAVSGPSEARKWIGHRLPPGVGFAGLVVKLGEGIWTPDVLSDPRFALPEEAAALVREEGYRAGISVPLTAQGTTLGALVLRDVHGRVFTEEDLHLLSAFADQASLALLHARLYEEAERRRREAEVVAEVARTINASLDLDTVFQRVADAARELTRSDTVTIALRDRASPVVRVRYLAGTQHRGFEGMEIQPGRGVGGQVLATGRPFRTGHYAEDPRISPEYLSQSLAAGVIAILAVPVTSGERVEGLLYAGRRSPRPFTDRDEAILLRLADHAAVAINNARLFAGEQAARAQAEAAVRALGASEEQYRALVEGSIQGMYIHQDFVTRFANPAMARIFGYDDAEQLIGLDYKTLIAPPEYARLRGYYAARMQGEPVPSRYEFEAVRRDGRRIWIEILVSLVTWKGEPAVLGTFLDITERRRAEAILAGERAVLELIASGVSLPDVLTALCRVVEAQFDGLLCSVLLIDADGLHLRHAAAPSLPEAYNRAIDGVAVAPRGGSCGTAAYRRAAVIVPDIERDPLWADYRELALRHGLRACWSTPVIGAGGAVLGTFAMYYREPRSPGEAERGLIERTTHLVRIAVEHSRAEEALRQSEAQLRQAQKIEAVGKLAGGVAHDFNNLLTVITGRTELLLSRLRRDHPDRHDLELIEKTAERAAALTQQLLAFSRKQILQPKVLDLNQVVEGLGAMLRRTIGEDIDLRIVPGPDLGRVKADPGQIEQVILNLCVNARDAMPRGGRLTLETANGELDAAFVRRHPGARPGRCVTLAVRDTGCGMDAETLAHVFEPFFTTKERGKGTGLGLSTVYGIVRQHEGYVAVESAPGRGSTFTIHLPRSDHAVEGLEPAAPPAWPRGGSETILLVEDERDVRDLAREIIEMAGYTVLAANGPGAGLEICERHRGDIDLLLTDVVMPGMSGPELAHRLVAARPRLKVLYMSGYTDDAIVKHGVLDFGTRFLQKPFTAESLARAVRDVLDAPRPPGP